MTTAGPPDAAAQARRLLRAVPMASLATAAADRQGWPYASLVAVAVDHDGTPVLLLSQLSDHTRNLREDPRAALLLDNTVGVANRMAGERLTVIGTLAPAPAARKDQLRTRYLARHPAAAAYEGFGDFDYWSMTVTSAHLIGGFAQAFWLDGAALMPSLPPNYALPAAEAEILQHMNADHRDAINVYAIALAKRAGGGWRMTGIDRDGIDLRSGANTARVGFDAPVDDANSAREALIQLAARARAAAAGA